MTSTPDSHSVAYLTSRYPAVSHTFILREIKALEELGLEIVPCSVRKPAEADIRGSAEQQEAERTFYILSPIGMVSRLLAAQSIALRFPGRYFGALAKAIGMRAPGLKALIWQVFYFFEATLLARHLMARGVSHLHNHFAGPSASVAVLAARMANIPFSFTLHGPADLSCPERWQLHEKAASAGFVACISQYARSQLMLHSDPEDWPRYHVVRCGVQPEIYARPEASRPGLRGETPTLVFVGRLSPAKGLRVLAEAFMEARRRIPGLQLTIVGDGVERDWLERRSADCSGAISLLGYKSQSEVAEILAASDIFVLPSFAEGVPVVLMEAMASGLPVVSTRITGVPELVEDGTSGILVPPGDTEALAEAICRLAGDPDLRLAMGAAGRGKVRRDFDIRDQVRLLATLLGTDTVSPVSS